VCGGQQDVLRVDPGRADARCDLLHQRVRKPAEVRLGERVLLSARAQHDCARDQTRVDADARLERLGVHAGVGVGDHLHRAPLQLRRVRAEEV
jgi:hypothetical protein